MSKENEQVQANPNDPKLEIKLQNYKLFEQFEASIDDFNVVMFEGDNEKGKTSLLTALKEAHSARSYTPEPVRRGQEQGKVTIKTLDKDGKEITVVQSFDKDKKKTDFVCFQEDGTPIRKVTKIRELLGDYLDITVSDFFKKASTKPGQQELIKDYLYKCLTEAQHKRVLEIDDKINKDSGVLYKNRTTVYSSMRDWEGSRDTLKLTDEETAMLEKLDKAKKRKEDLQEELNGIESQKAEKSLLQNEISAIDSHKQRVSRMNFDDEIRDKLSKAADLIEGLLKAKEESIDVSQQRIDELKGKLKKAEEYIDTIQDIKVKQSKYLDAVSNYEHKKSEYDQISEEIEKLRKERMDIFKKSNLPETISIDEEGFKLDSYDFAESQVSESKAALAIAELLASISTNKLITLGDGSMFNSERLKKLCQIAEKHGKFVALTRVVDGEDIKAVGIVE